MTDSIKLAADKGRKTGVSGLFLFLAAGGQVYQTVTVEKGRKWTFSAWVRADNLTDGGARVKISGGITDQRVAV